MIVRFLSFFLLLYFQAVGFYTISCSETNLDSEVTPFTTKDVSDGTSEVKYVSTETMGNSSSSIVKEERGTVVDDLSIQIALVPNKKYKMKTFIPRENKSLYM